eukprot:g141.t1
MGAIPDFVASETGWIVAGVAANLAILIALCNIIRHLRNYHTPHLQIWTVRIIVIVPVYAFVSWMSLKLPEEALYFNTVRDVYEAYIIYCFIALMLAYGGGENNCLVLMRSRGHLAHPFPFNFCLQPMLLDAKFMRRCKQGCIQFVILKPILALMSLVLMGVGKYDSTGYQAFLLTVYNISYTVALYYLFLFYLATREILKEQHIVLKFFAVKTVVFLTYWQMLAVEAWPGLSTEDGEACNDFILCIEMVFFAILHMRAFSCEDAKDSSGTFRGQSGMMNGSVIQNARQVVSINDVIDDAYHNFMPEYQDYVQASNGSAMSPTSRSSHEKPRKFKSKIFVKPYKTMPLPTNTTSPSSVSYEDTDAASSVLAAAVPVDDGGDKSRKKSLADRDFETEMTDLHSRLEKFENETSGAVVDITLSPPPK